MATVPNRWSIDESSQGKRISSGWTWWHRNVSVCSVAFSAALVAALPIVFVIATWGNAAEFSLALLVVIPSAFFVAIAWNFCRMLRSVANEVRLVDDHLVVLHGRRKRCIPLREITGVKAGILKIPEIIRIGFRQPDDTPTEIAFIAGARSWYRHAHPILAELDACIVEAKQNEASIFPGAPRTSKANVWH